MNWCRDIELDSELTRCNVVVVYDHDCMDLIDLIFSNSFYTQISQKFNFKFLKYDYYSDECKKFSKLYSVICTPLVYFISKDSSECIVGDVTNENCIKHLKIFLNPEEIKEIENLYNELIIDGKGHIELTTPIKKQKPSQDFEQRMKNVRENRIFEGADKHANDLMDQRETDRQKQLKQILKDKKEDEERRKKILQKIEQSKKERSLIDEEIRKARIIEDLKPKIVHRNPERQALINNAEALRQQSEPVHHKSTDNSQTANILKKSDFINIGLQNNDSPIAKIRLKFPNNVTKNIHIPETELLNSIILYIINNTNYAKFRLVSSYSRCVYTDKDKDKTLVSLNLTPSSVLNVEIYEANVSNKFPFYFNLPFMRLFNASYTFAAYLYNSLFSLFTNQNLTNPVSSKKPRNFKLPDSFRNVTSIHKNNDNSDSDDQATYNGNSTQQL